MASNWAKFCAISCTHCPHQSERAIAKLIEELHIRKPQVFVHCGDVVDADAASVHSDDSDSVSLHEEFLVASDMLRRIREALPEDCKLVLLDGNHDDNIQRQSSCVICATQERCMVSQTNTTVGKISNTVLEIAFNWEV